MAPSPLALWILVRVSIFVIFFPLPLSLRICTFCLSVLFVLIVNSSFFFFLVLSIGHPPGASFFSLIWIVQSSIFAGRLVTVSFIPLNACPLSATISPLPVFVVMLWSRGKCRCCPQPGHLAQNCKNALRAWGAAPPAGSRSVLISRSTLKDFTAVSEGYHVVCIVLTQDVLYFVPIADCNWWVWYSRQPV